MTTKDLAALDREVGEKVMGWKPGGYEPCWTPSIDFEQAMKVVAKIQKQRCGIEECAKGWEIEMLWDGEWNVEIRRHNPFDRFSAVAPTLPEAICRAALEAVEVKPKSQFEKEPT